MLSLYTRDPLDGGVLQWERSQRMADHCIDDRVDAKTGQQESHDTVHEGQ